MGCALTLAVNDDCTLSVSGNQCKRGEAYAKEEYSAPRRTITATVACDSPEFPRVPVKTASPLPKKLVSDLLAELKKTRVTLPVAMGDILISNFKDSGVSVVITRTCQ